MEKKFEITEKQINSIYQFLSLLPFKDVVNLVKMLEEIYATKEVKDAE